MESHQNRQPPVISNSLRTKSSARQQPPVKRMTHCQQTVRKRLQIFSSTDRACNYIAPTNLRPRAKRHQKERERDSAKATRTGASLQPPPLPIVSSYRVILSCEIFFLLRSQIIYTADAQLEKKKPRAREDTQSGRGLEVGQAVLPDS